MNHHRQFSDKESADSGMAGMKDQHFEYFLP
jgi:hypothetical protein